MSLFRASILKSSIAPSSFRIFSKRFASSHGGEEINEPTGYLFNVKPGEKPLRDSTMTVFKWGFLGGIAVFLFLYRYKPDTSSYTWAMNEACLRMQERGIDLSPVAETVGFKIK